MVEQRGVFKKKIFVSASNISILNSQIDIIIVGEKNKIKIEDSAGKICFTGDENQI